MQFTRLFVLIAIPLLFISATLHAQVVVRTEHDIRHILSPVDRELLDRMPSNVKDQMLDLIRRSIPIIDSSLKSFVDTVSVAMRDRVSQLGCVSRDALENIGSGAIAGIRGKLPDRISLAQKIYENRQDEFDSKPVTLIGASYGDLLRWVETVGCNTQEPAVLSWVRKMQSDVRPKQHAWAGLDANCGTPHMCVVQRRAKVQQLISSGDARDLEKANAKLLLSKIEMPAEPSARIANFLKSAGSKYPQWLAVEPALVALDEIEILVTTAEVIRKVSARSQLADALGRVIDAEAVLKRSSLALSDVDVSSNRSASSAASGAIADKATFVALLDASAKQNISLSAEANLIRDRIAAAESESRSIQAKATQNIRSIEDLAEQARIRRDAADARKWDERLNKPRPGPDPRR